LRPFSWRRRFLPSRHRATASSPTCTSGPAGRPAAGRLVAAAAQGRHLTTLQQLDLGRLLRAAGSAVIVLRIGIVGRDRQREKSINTMIRITPGKTANMVQKRSRVDMTAKQAA